MVKKDVDGLPIHVALPGAVEGGVFGRDESGGLRPDRSQVRALTVEHVLEMVALLTHAACLERRAALGLDPRTGKRPRGTAGAKRMERLDNEASELTCRYQELLAAYAEGFGDMAADEIDRFVRSRVVGESCCYTERRLF